MKQVFSLLAVFFIIIMLTACGGDDPKSIMKDSIKTMETFITDMDSADSAGDVADAMEQFVDDMKDLAPRWESLKKKFPDYDFKKNYPEDLKELGAKAEELSAKLVGAMGKMAKYMTDPKVIAAMKKFGEIAKSMN
ncbi:MAG: hypothetical protein GY765_38700 [bacterium]|nr:hypothetical protein [bacterium]